MEQNGTLYKSVYFSVYGIAEDADAVECGDDDNSTQVIGCSLMQTWDNDLMVNINNFTGVTTDQCTEQCRDVGQQVAFTR